jgi:predicted  nucleic acid-binding Zn-ribbon protein
MNFLKNLKNKIFANKITTTLFILFILIIVALGVPYLTTEDKEAAQENLIKSITNPQTIPQSLIEITEGFSEDQINIVKTLTDKFSIEQIIQLEQKLVDNNLEWLDLKLSDSTEKDTEYDSGSISVKRELESINQEYENLNKDYENLNKDYENLIKDYENLNNNFVIINKENETTKSKMIPIVIGSDQMKKSITDLNLKIKKLENEITASNILAEDITSQNKESSEKITELNYNIEDFNAKVEKLNLEIESYKTTKIGITSALRTGQSANYKFDWLELDKNKENDSRYFRMDLTNFSEVHPYQFRLMNYLPTGSMRPLLDENSLGVVEKTTAVNEFNIGDIVSYVPPSYDDSYNDMEGCDMSLESVAKSNYNHISHRIVDKQWDETKAEWKYVPKGDNNNIHDGCFIYSKDIKYRLEMLIKLD